MAGKEEIVAKILKADGSSLEEKDSDILAPVLHLMSAPRKSILRRIIPAINYWLKAPEEIVEKVTYIVEIFNEACYL